MIGLAVRTVSTLASTAAVTYVVFFVPVGSRTLAQHAQRIAGTAPAQELGREVAASGRRAGEALLEGVRRSNESVDGGVQDAAHAAR